MNINFCLIKKRVMTASPCHHAILKSLPMGVLGLALLTSCADWNDHYDADTSLLSSQHATLWDNIQSNAELSQFASLLKKVGYDEILNTTQTYTVWAPKNGSFDFDVINALSNSRLQKEFVENHIARSNFPVSGSVNQRVYTLNEKHMNFTGAGQYAIQNVGVAQSNLASSNGVIHVIDGKIPFMANIYEALTPNDYPLDSISEFFHSYDVKKLNERKSVQGPTVNGEITYLDSVFDEHNDLFTRYFAYINREDSNYTMLVPTNEAWQKAREAISPYFNYVHSFEFMENTSTGTDQKKITVNIRNLDYLRDSVINQMLMNDLFYNNNLYDNRKLNALQTGQQLNVDSLYSTTLTKIYSEDARRLFENARRVEMSNGAIWVTDSLRMRPWTTWNPEIIVEAEHVNTLSSTAFVAENGPERVNVVSGTQNPEVRGHVSNNSFIELTPISQSTNPRVVFYLPEVRSTTYSIYVVVVPANIVSSTREAKPYQFNATLGCADASGKNQDKENKWLVESSFISDPTRVDTIYLGDFTFPVAYAGTGDYYPYLRINSSVANKERDLFDRTLRIDCVILRPKELDNYLKEHPDYKYDVRL